MRKILSKFGVGAASASELAGKLRPLIWKFGGTFLILSLASVLLYFSGQIAWGEILGHLGRFKLSALVSVAALGILQTVLQAGRLWVLLPKGLLISFATTCRGFWLAQIMNQVLPARAGDLYKVGFLKKHSRSESESNAIGSTELFGSVFIADKTTDILSLVLILSFLAPGWASEHLSSDRFKSLMRMEIDQAILVGILLSLTIFFVSWKVLPKLSQVITGTLRGAKALTDPTRAIPALALSIASWGVESQILQLLAAQLGYSIALPDAMMALALLNVGIAVPVSFANLGAFEGALAFGLSRFSIALPEALAIAAVHHALQFTSVILPAVASTLLVRGRAIAGQRLREQDKARALQYYQDRSVAYSQTVSSGPLVWLRKRETEAVMNALDLPQEKQELSLLDVGCGDGKYSLTAKARGLTVSALDACPGMISNLSGKVDSAQVIDWEAYNVAVTYDRVLCAGMLDFVVEPEGSFKKLCQSVDSKGKLVVLVPKHGIGGIFYRVEKYLSGFRVNLYRVEELERWARQEGLSLTTTSHPLPNNMVLSFDRS